MICFKYVFERGREITLISDRPSNFKVSTKVESIVRVQQLWMKLITISCEAHI